MSWHNAFRNIKLANLSTQRQRDRDGKRHVRRSLFALPIVGRRRGRQPRSAWVEFLSLTLPGLLLGFFGLMHLEGPSTSWNSLWILGLSLGCIVFAVRAATADAPRWVRLIAVAVSCAFPVLALFS